MCNRVITIRRQFGGGVYGIGQLNNVGKNGILFLLSCDNINKQGRQTPDIRCG